MTAPSPADADPRLAAAHAWVRDLRARFRTVILGTTSADGEPDASVSPAALAPDGALLIYVSGLARHTRNVLATRRASVLLIEDEATAPQPLARRRLTLTCTAEPLARDNAEHPAALRCLHENLGPAFDLIAGLGDFQLIRLRPQRGRLVAGFGQACDVDPGDWRPRPGPPATNRPRSSPP